MSRVGLPPQLAGDLALALGLLARPVSAQERERVRATLVRVKDGLTVVDGTEAPPATREEAEQRFLSAAVELAAWGASEMDLRDLLSGDDGCLTRASARAAGRATTGGKRTWR